MFCNSRLSVALKYLPEVFSDIYLKSSSSISTFVKLNWKLPLGKIETGAKALPFVPRPIV